MVHSSTHDSQFGQLFRDRFMHIEVSLPLAQALDLGWKTMAECFTSDQLLMKQALIDKYFPKQMPAVA